MLCMRVERRTGFKTTTRHPASRQMCSTPRDKTRDDSSSFVKPFSGWDGREGRGGRGGRGIAVYSKPMKCSVKDTSFCIPCPGARVSLLKRNTCREGHSSLPFQKTAVEGDFEPCGERVANRVGRIHFRLPSSLRFATIPLLRVASYAHVLLRKRSNPSFD